MITLDASRLPEFDNHEDISYMFDDDGLIRAIIAFHRCRPGRPSFGATRYFSYISAQEAVRDALRLSKLMSYKAALAGLPYGGAKAVIIGKGILPSKRRKILRRYAEKICEFKGRFITGTDMGLEVSDIRFMNDIAPYFVGLRVDPTYYTAVGIITAIKICLEERFGDSDITGRTFAIKGTGKIGYELLKRLSPSARKIYVADIDEKKLIAVKEKFPNAIIVPTDEIAGLKVDVFSPCAIPHSLDEKSASKFQCAIIAGGANNQLENPAVSEKLFRSGILYAPDYVINAGGLISVACEYENVTDQKTIVARVKNIGVTLKNIFTESRRRDIAPALIADRMAQKILTSHPAHAIFANAVFQHDTISTP